jgi:hypothetical protein
MTQIERIYADFYYPEYPDFLRHLRSFLNKISISQSPPEI